MKHKQISKNSWHYRLISQCQTTVPQNSCTYFWTLIYNLIFIAFGFILTVIIIPLILGLMISSFIDVYTDILIKGNELHNIIISYVVGILFVGISGTLIFLYFKYSKPSTKIYRKTDKDCLITTFVKDVKNKHCTLLEFTDDK